MQNSPSKPIGIIVVMIIIIVGIWLMTRDSSSDREIQNTSAVQVQTFNPSSSSTTPSDSISSSGMSDAALNQDAAAIDAQLGTLSAESGAASSTQ